MVGRRDRFVLHLLALIYDLHVKVIYNRYGADFNVLKIGHTSVLSIPTIV
jgi:hypothetical protein